MINCQRCNKPVRTPDDLLCVDCVAVQVARHLSHLAGLAPRLTDTQPGEIEQRILREEVETLNEAEL